MVPGAYNNNMQLVQTSDAVVIVNEMVHEHRIVPLDGRPRVGRPIQLWMGSSRGRWDGDTLVVDTTNFKPAVFRSASGALHTSSKPLPAGRDADTLLYEFTVDDPATWTQPWTAQIPMVQEPRADLRIRLPRGQLQPAQYSPWGARAAER